MQKLHRLGTSFPQRDELRNTGQSPNARTVRLKKDADVVTRTMEEHRQHETKKKGTLKTKREKLKR